MDTFEQLFTKTLNRIVIDLPLGGPGSGNWAHVGRKGKVGGSATRNEGMTVAKGQDWLDRYAAKAGHKHVYEQELEKEAAGKKQKAAEEAAAKKQAEEAAAAAKKKADEEAAAKKQAEEAKKVNTPTSTPDITGPEDAAKFTRAKKSAGMNAIRNTGSQITTGSMNDYLTRSNVKNELVTELAKRSGQPYEDVNTVVHQWANSSNDTDYRSLGLQEDIAAEFGVQLSKWQSDKIASLKASGQANDENHALGQPTYNSYGVATSAKPDPHGRARRILRAMYDYTQEQLAAQGIKEVTLFRGVQTTSYTLNKATAGQQVGWRGNAAESWSATAKTAYAFSQASGVVVAAKIPASRILSFCRTGFGCLSEEEFVVFGNTGASDTVVIAKPVNTYMTVK